MHGGLRPKKIIEDYEQIINSPHGVLILGTAQYLSIPRLDLGVIIVEHENSYAYKMFPRPHFDLRIFSGSLCREKLMQNLYWLILYYAMKLSLEKK